MIAHQDKGVETPARTLRRLAESADEGRSITVASHNRLLPIPTVQHVVNRTGEFDPPFARHGQRLSATLFERLAKKSENHRLTRMALR